MLAGAAITWARQEPYIAADEVAAAQAAGEAVGGLPQGTPLVFVVDSGDATAGFLAPRAENVIRAAVPPERIADVHVYVGTLADEEANRPTVRGDPQFDALSRTYLAAIHDAEMRTSENPVTFVLQPFAPTAFASARHSGLVLGEGAVLMHPQDVDQHLRRLDQYNVPHLDALRTSSDGEEGISIAWEDPDGNQFEFWAPDRRQPVVWYRPPE